MGDQTLRNVLTRVRQTLTGAQEGGPNDMKVLSEIGVSFQKDGTLAIDSTKLAGALSKNLEALPDCSPAPPAVPAATASR